MKSTVIYLLFGLGSVWTGLAYAQSVPAAGANDCPALPADTASSVRWEALRFPETLLCRAVSNDQGNELFVVTISRQSPFRPRRGDRAETAMIDGQQLFWYRAELANAPNTLIRETLVELGPDRVAHVFMRVESAEALSSQQQIVHSLDFTPQLAATR